MSVRIRLEVPIFMSQPIFAIKKSKVKEIIEHQSKFTGIPYQYDWGSIRSMEQMIGTIDGIKSINGYIKMHDLHTIFQMLESNKMMPHANRMLHRVLAICKCYREDLNKISVE